MHTPFACSDYYETSAPPAASAGYEPARRRPGRSAVRATADGSHVHHEPIDEGGVQLNPGSLASEYAADLPRGLPHRPIHSRLQESPARGAGRVCAADRTADPPGLESARRLRSFTHWFLARTPSRLAPHEGARRAVPTRPGYSPATACGITGVPPGSGCPQLHQAAATAQRQGLSPHSDSSRFVAHDQIIEPAMRIITGPTVQLGLNLPYPSLRTKQRELRFVGIHRRRPSISASSLPTCWPPSPCARLSRASDYTGPPPATAVGRKTDPPAAGRLPGGEGNRDSCPRSPRNRSMEGCAALTPTASPRLRRSSPTWPPHRTDKPASE